MDTIRTLSQLLALFADNTSGEISAQDLRDFTVTANDWSTSKSPENSVTGGGTAKAEYITLAASATQVITTIASGAGFIKGLFVAGGSPDYLAYERSLVKIYINGEVTPSVSCTLANFHAADYIPDHAFLTKFIGYNQGTTGTDKGYENWYFIPYTNGCKVEITNGSATDNFYFISYLQYNNCASTVDFGRKARLKNSEQRSTTAAYTEKELLNLPSGRGQLWMIYCLFDGGDSNYNYLEGNVKFYIDGEATASYNYPGTEDYFMNSHYFAAGTLCGDNAGTTRKAGDIVGAYRIHDTDPIYFNNGIRVTVTLGDASQATVTNPVYLSSNVLYYLDS